MPVVRAVVVEDDTLSSAALLQAALARSGFWTTLSAARRRAKVSADALRILIKPDLEAFALGSPVITDPALVEHLIDLLHARGYTHVNLCASAESAYFWSENRDVAVLADLLGYRYETPAGCTYDVLDLGCDLEPGGFSACGVLEGERMSAAWRDAHFRVLFARNKTDEREGYALCLQGLLGTLPRADKDLFYRQQRSAGDVACALVAAAPAHFALIDATVSAHGSGGARAPEAIHTHTLIACADPALADYVGALKMGLDPYVSPLAAQVFRTRGLPQHYRVDGNLGAYLGWRNVDAALRDSTQMRARLPVADRLLTPLLQMTDSELFPLQRVADAKLNPRISRYFATADDDPVVRALLLCANYAVGVCGQWLEAYRVLYDKDALARVEVPLGFDPEAIGNAAFAAVCDELDALAWLVRDLEPAGDGLRWREVDGATVFEYRRELPIDFELFIARVDVAQTIGLMNDYIGGCVVPLERDEEGRVLRQAERNLYLPQPNYLILYQGKHIDVSKIEVCDYSATQHRMYWKTIASSNASATADDGIVTFTRTTRGTALRIVGKQQFTLPPLLQAIDLNLVPELKQTLVTHAYQTFFDRTCANFEAKVEGRDVRIGRAGFAAEDAFASQPLPMEGLERVATDLATRFQTLLDEGAFTSLLKPSTTVAGGSVDAHGFTHFDAGPLPATSGTAALRTLIAPLTQVLVDFLRGFGAAMRRDFVAVNAPRSEDAS